MYTEKEARELVIEAGLKLVESKLIARTWGNISARISDTEFVITPSGRAYDSLTASDLVKIRIKDLSYEGDIKPSSEKGIHAACYRNRPDCNFVIHTHQHYASAVAANELSTDFAPCAAYGLPGTDKLWKNTEACIKDNPGYKMFLLAKHGTLLLGSSYEEAFSLAGELEIRSEECFGRRVPSMDVQKFDKIDQAKVKSILDKKNKTDIKVVLQQDPYVLECCYAGTKLYPYIDDYAQIVGPDADCCKNNPRKIAAALKDRSAVLVKGVGAVCIGADEDDAEAVAMIMSKNCAAACYARNTKPLNAGDAYLQRYIYLKKYSKLK